MFALMTALLLAPPPAKPGAAPAPPKAVNREQPKNHRPYLAKQRVEGARASAYHRDHGHRFKHGWWFDGFRHPHWSHHYWDARYGAWLYYDPGLTTYYYWCAPHYRFYPVSYVPLNNYSYDFEEEPKPPATPPPAPPPYEGKP